MVNAVATFHTIIQLERFLPELQFILIYRKTICNYKPDAKTLQLCTVRGKTEKKTEK